MDFHPNEINRLLGHVDHLIEKVRRLEEEVVKIARRDNTSFLKELELVKSVSTSAADELQQLRKFNSDILDEMNSLRQANTDLKSQVDLMKVDNRDAKVAVVESTNNLPNEVKTSKIKTSTSHKT